MTHPVEVVHLDRLTFVFHQLLDFCNMKNLFLILGGVLATCIFWGCNSSPQANYENLALVQVSGNVKLDGQPLSGAIVKFEADNGNFSSGMTDSNGHYALRFDSEKQGVTPGDKTVRISTAASLGEGEEIFRRTPRGRGRRIGRSICKKRRTRSGKIQQRLGTQTNRETQGRPNVRF